MMETNKIKKHYKKIAKDDGASKQSSMKDINIRDLEVNKILDVLGVATTYFDNPAILEAGCGNGYTAELAAKKLNIQTIKCVDFCEDLIKIAKKRSRKGLTYEVGDVLNLKFEDSSFDIVFTERCLINLESWEKQQKALDEIWRVLKKDGFLIMVEAFADSLKYLNGARAAVGLDPIAQPFHNLFFERKKFLNFIRGKFENLSSDHSDPQFGDCENFLSSYYFGSKVIYPALIAGRKELEYNNKFVEFFRYMPAFGNYGYVNMFVLRKK